MSRSRPQGWFELTGCHVMGSVQHRLGVQLRYIRRLRPRWVGRAGVTGAGPGDRMRCGPQDDAAATVRSARGGMALDHTGIGTVATG